MRTREEILENIAKAEMYRDNCLDGVGAFNEQIADLRQELAELEKPKPDAVKIGEMGPNGYAKAIDDWTQVWPIISAGTQFYADLTGKIAAQLAINEHVASLGEAGKVDWKDGGQTKGYPNFDHIDQKLKITGCSVIQSSPIFNVPIALAQGVLDAMRKEILIVMGVTEGE